MDWRATGCGFGCMGLWVQPKWKKEKLLTKQKANMSVLKNKLIVPHGTMKVEGVTFYQRKGTTVMRSATSQQPHRRTSRQFEARQRMANCTALWKALRAATEPVLHGGKSSYGRFCTLMRKLPVAYLTKDERLKGAALLMPGMPVSDGMLPDIECQLGQVEGRPALLTSLRLSAGARSIPSLLYGPRAELKKSERLCLFRLRQRMPETDPEAVPRVAVRVEMLDIENCRDQEPFAGIELMDVDGRLALVGDTLGDDTMGWALVRMDGDNVSSQRVVTRCRLYEQYITDQAQERAAKSYGGLTPSPYLMPNGN